MISDLESLYEDIYLTEGVGSDIGHVALDIAGLGADFLGGQGGWFDAINAVWYASEKNYLYAALSLISVIPIIGDIVGKGGKYLNMFEKSRKVGAGMYKAGKTMKSAKTVGMIAKAKKSLKNPVLQKQINAVLELASKNEKLKPHINDMVIALDEFANDPVETV